MILESHELLCDHINQEEEAIIITPTIVDSIPILVILHTGGSDSSQILPVLPNPIKRVSKNPINMKNVGSKTKGTDGKTIANLAKYEPKDLVLLVRNKLRNFQPQKVRRVEIPKPDGKMRPLGIPTISDRLVQQCILQVMEPICEAKFYKHSYGFRPLRGTKDAIARAQFLAQMNNLHYVVDVDIKGFFDNIDHGKLLKQIWSLGIRDKALLSIISKMLKAEIEGIGIPAKE